MVFFHEDKFEFGSLFLKQVVRLLLNININLKLVLKINIVLNLRRIQSVEQGSEKLKKEVLD